MACYHPLDAWRSPSGQVLLAYNARYCHSRNPDFKLPCGRCIGCRLDLSRKWAVRCMHEAQMHKDNCFITLTYDDAKLPERPDGVPPANVSLYYEDFQLFMKRLRKRFTGKTIRFYMCGEYGENFHRPHFHACIFGLDFPDREFFARTASKSIIYRSKILEELWPYGFSSIGNFNYQSAAYVARYCLKKIVGNGGYDKHNNYIHPDDHYAVVDPLTGEILYWKTPEFNKMSRRPGIGGTWFDKFETDVFPHDHVIVNSKPVSVPRYYDTLFTRRSTDNLVDMETVIKPARLKKAILSLDDNTPERLLVKEQVAKANLLRLKRKLS